MALVRGGAGWPAGTWQGGMGISAASRLLAVGAGRHLNPAHPGDAVEGAMGAPSKPKLTRPRAGAPGGSGSRGNAAEIGSVGGGSRCGGVKFIAHQAVREGRGPVSAVVARGTTPDGVIEGA